MKREKRTDPCGTPRWTRKDDFCDFDKPRKRAYQKETMGSSRNELMEKSRVLDRVKSSRKINSREDRPRAWPGFVKPNQNGLRKEQNLI